MALPPRYFRHTPTPIKDGVLLSSAISIHSFDQSVDQLLQPTFDVCGMLLAEKAPSTMTTKEIGLETNDSPTTASDSSFAIIPPLLPSLQQLNALSKLFNRRLIDTAPSSRDQFRIEFSMIDSTVSGDCAHE